MKRIVIVAAAGSILAVAAVVWLRVLGVAAVETVTMAPGGPTASLDTERGKSAIDHLRRAAREKSSAVIVVTHDERMIVGFDRLGRVQDGRLPVSPAEVAA
jgi:predicted ABC-type transport system involved in lysophospholipase L1 biosynthesis ATPase subunit